MQELCALDHSASCFVLTGDFPNWLNDFLLTMGSICELNSVPIVQAKQPSEEWCDHVGGIQRRVVGPTSPCVSFPGLFVILRQQLAAEDLYFLEQQHVAFKVVIEFSHVNTADLLGSFPLIQR